MKGDDIVPGKIQEIFSLDFADHNITIPVENLRERKRGSIPFGSGRIYFIFGIENGLEYLEYYRHHRIGGDAHKRIYADGRIVFLDDLCSCYFF